MECYLLLEREQSGPICAFQVKMVHFKGNSFICTPTSFDSLLIFEAPYEVCVGSLVQQVQQRYIGMGNADITADTKIMARHSDLVADFFNHRPLFNVEEVTLPLSTHGIKIVDATGRRVKLAGGNWSGGHMCRHCVDGLECRPMWDIALDIRHKFKMNCIRLTYSLQLFYDDKPVPEKYLKANPELIGKTGIQIFDHTVKTLTDVGLMVILNNHTSTSQWCCSDDDGDGLWWSYEFPEYKFFENCEFLARRYANNPRVIGMDLRNELRKAHRLEPTWGDGNPLTDWHRAATIVANKVLKIAPHWLIMVSGLNYQLDLTGVQKTSVDLIVPNKLVYTGHFYGFSWPIPSWNLVSYQQFKKKLFNSQTFVRGLGYPYFLGEYGNNCKDIPWKYLIRYLEETDIDWTYWALDGFKCHPDDDETYGVFTNDFSRARHPDMLEDMISVGVPKGTTIPAPKAVQPYAHSQNYVPHQQHNQLYSHLVQGSHQSPPPQTTHVVISMTNSTLKDSPSKMFRSKGGITVTQNPKQQTPKKPSQSPSPVTSPVKGVELGPIVPSYQQQQYKTEVLPNQYQGIGNAGNIITNNMLGGGFLSSPKK